MTRKKPHFEAQEIRSCRLCGNANLLSVLKLGTQTLTGVFPRHRDTKISSGPLELVKCEGNNSCGLLQLRHSFDSDQMYGTNYGYRSSLNQSMVHHLQNKVQEIQSIIALKPQDIVLDIGSNDGTLLSFYPKDTIRVGMDPTIEKFHRFYDPEITAIPDFFSEQAFVEKLGDRKSKIITSIAMFYDLEDPREFVRQIGEVLAEDGIWHFEQSYMPAMIRQTAYDTICHEHLEYYGLKQIKWLMDRCSLRILNVDINQANGGSFAVTVCHENAPLKSQNDRIEEILSSENRGEFHSLTPYIDFKKRVFDHREQLIAKLAELHAKGNTVFGYGASTKGNVILQFCGLTERDLPMIAEVNEDKFGAFTPGTHIPIVSEQEAHLHNPDYFLVFPWHFKKNLIDRETGYLEKGGKLLFPLPQIEIVEK